MTAWNDKAAQREKTTEGVPAEHLTIKEVARRCLDAQSATNLHALVVAWATWQHTIRNHADAQDLNRNTHTINILMAEKIAQLAVNEPTIGITAFDSDHYNRVEALATA